MGIDGRRFAHKVDEAGFILPPAAFGGRPPREGDTNTSKINECYSHPREGESRRRRQGVDWTDFLCKADGRLESIGSGVYVYERLQFSFNSCHFECL